MYLLNSIAKLKSKSILEVSVYKPQLLYASGCYSPYARCRSHVDSHKVTLKQCISNARAKRKYEESFIYKTRVHYSNHLYTAVKYSYIGFRVVCYPLYSCYNYLKWCKRRYEPMIKKPVFYVPKEERMQIELPRQRSLTLVEMVQNLERSCYLMHTRLNPMPTLYSAYRLSRGITFAAYRTLAHIVTALTTITRYPFALAWRVARYFVLLTLFLCRASLRLVYRTLLLPFEVRSRGLRVIKDHANYTRHMTVAFVETILHGLRHPVKLIRTLRGEYKLRHGLEKPLKIRQEIETSPFVTFGDKFTYYKRDILHQTVYNNGAVLGAIFIFALIFGYQAYKHFLSYSLEDMDKIDMVKRLGVLEHTGDLLEPPLEEPFYQPKFTLAVEFDHLLALKESRPGFFERFRGSREVNEKFCWRKRPFFDHFLDCAGYPVFELVVYSNYRDEVEMEKVWSHFDPNWRAVHKFGREKALVQLLDNRPANELRYPQLFRKRWPGVDARTFGRDPDKVIIVDHNTDMYKYTSRNVVGIPKWNGNENDEELLHLGNFLRTLYAVLIANKVESVQPVLSYYAGPANRRMEIVPKFLQAQKQMAEQRRQSDKAQPGRQKTVSRFAGPGRLKLG